MMLIKQTATALCLVSLLGCVPETEQTNTTPPQKLTGYPVVSADAFYSTFKQTCAAYAGNTNGLIAKLRAMGYRSAGRNGAAHAYVRSNSDAGVNVVKSKNACMLFAKDNPNLRKGLTEKLKSDPKFKLQGHSFWVSAGKVTTFGHETKPQGRVLSLTTIKLR